MCVCVCVYVHAHTHTLGLLSPHVCFGAYLFTFYSCYSQLNFKSLRNSCRHHVAHLNHPLTPHSPPIPSQYETTDTPKDQHPAIYDYTPPSYISLLFTDLGVLTPSAVSDELIKLYR